MAREGLMDDSGYNPEPSEAEERAWGEGYEQGKKDAEEECDRCIYSGMKPFLKRRKDAYLDGYDEGMAKANKEHEEMCKTCIE